MLAASSVVAYFRNFQNATGQIVDPFAGIEIQVRSQLCRRSFLIMAVRHALLCSRRLKLNRLWIFQRVCFSSSLSFCIDLIAAPDYWRAPPTHWMPPCPSLRNVDFLHLHFHDSMKGGHLRSRPLKLLHDARHVGLR